MQHYQEYDSSLKALIQAQIPEMLGLLIEGAEFISELNCEVLKPQPPLRVDKVFKILYRGQTHLYHLEAETSSNCKMPHRMLTYFALLYEEYEWPIIQMVMYPFRTTLPETPLRVMSGQQEILRLDYRILPLWELLAQQFVDQHALAIYPLLPTMKGANAELLLQAIQEMTMRYNGRELSRRLVWFRTFLNRVETLPAIDKRVVKERLEMFDELLEQDPDIRKRIELAEVQGTAKGEAQAIHRIAISVVRKRFPSLAEFAQEKMLQIDKPEVLDTLVTEIAVAPDENAVRLLLNTLAA